MTRRNAIETRRKRTDRSETQPGTAPDLITTGFHDPRPSKRKSRNACFQSRVFGTLRFVFPKRAYLDTKAVIGPRAQETNGPNFSTLPLRHNPQTELLNPGGYTTRFGPATPPKHFPEYSFWGTNNPRCFLHVLQHVGRESAQCI